MNKLNEMWAAFTAYQPQADAAGHGDSWAKMCKKKTASDAYAAWSAAAYAAASAADADAAYAAYAAVDAVYADYDDYKAHFAERWAQKAIERINKVLVKPAQPQQEPATTPPQRTWVGLTEEELYEIYDESDDGSSPCGVCGACSKCKIEVAIARAIEAKLKKRNEN